MELPLGGPIPVSGLYCFGDNSEGNLGDENALESTSQSAIPLPILLSVPVRFVSVAAGLYHSLALTGTRNFIFSNVVYRLGWLRMRDIGEEDQKTKNA